MESFERRTHMMLVRLDRIGNVRFKTHVHVDVERVFDVASSRKWYHLWSDDLCIGGTGETTEEAWKDLESTLLEYHKAKDPIVSDLIRAIDTPSKPTQVSPLYCPGKNDTPRRRLIHAGAVRVSVD